MHGSPPKVRLSSADLMQREPARQFNAAATCQGLYDRHDGWHGRKKQQHLLLASAAHSHNPRFARTRKPSLAYMSPLQNLTGSSGRHLYVC